MTPYWSGDGITLYYGDCREVTAWLETDVLVTDPPYGINHAGNAGRVSPVVKVAGDENFDIATAAIAQGAHLPMAVCANHASLQRTLGQVCRHHERVRTMAWFKTNVNGATPGNPWLADLEFVVCGVPEWPKRAVSGLISARRFTGNPAWNSSPDAYLHPTQKPVQVMERVIQAMPPGTVADPFAGSGSTLVAAKLQGRKAVGVELEEKYCEISARRLSQGVLDFGEASA